jgi:hypothetical protein
MNLEKKVMTQAKMWKFLVFYVWDIAPQRKNAKLKYIY